MKTFSSFLSHSQIRAACKKRGFKYSQEKFDQGGDHITFTFVHGKVRCKCCYSTFNGQCFGELEGVKGHDWFTTDSTEFERKAWFKALLDFIYVTENKPAETPA